MAESSRPLLSSWQIKQRFGVLERVSLSPLAMLWLVIAFDDAKDTDMICSRILCQEPRHDGWLCRWNKTVRWVSVWGTRRHAISICFYDKAHLLSSLNSFRLKCQPRKGVLALGSSATVRSLLSLPQACTIHFYYSAGCFSTQWV